MDTSNSCRWHGRVNCPDCAALDGLYEVLRPVIRRISTPTRVLLRYPDQHLDPRPVTLRLLAIAEPDKNWRLYLSEKGEWNIASRSDPLGIFQIDHRWGMEPTEIFRTTPYEMVRAGVEQAFDSAITKRQDNLEDLIRRRDQIRGMRRVE